MTAGELNAAAGGLKGAVPTVTVIMPVRNEEAFIARSLGAVLGQDYEPAAVDVLVVDGMSDDATRYIVRTMAEDAEVPIRLLDNPGRIAPTALNVGLRHARGEVIVRVDGHCEIAPDYVSAGVRHLLQDGVDGVGGPLDTIGDTPTARAIAVAMGHRFGVGGSAFRTAGADAPSRLVDTVAFPIYRRSAIELAGGFDEELVRNQDDEYNYRLRKLGGQILLTGDVRAKYYSRSGFRSLWRQYYQYGVWKVRVLQKHTRQMRPRQFVPLIFVLALLTTLAAATVSPLGRLGFAAVTGTYLVTNLAVALRAHPSGFLRVALAFSILHLSYGTGFLVGLVRFAGRWGDRQGRAPSSVLPPPSST
ncbi:MAG: glycosyltransferase family 2 protein [Acidobacteriota bacterium]